MSQPTKSRESGFALILALLALVLLTTMGLALSNSTSIELQISSNQRWSESARYNAEAGIEYGKSLLMAVPGDWATILPVARPLGSAWAPTTWAGTAATGTPLLTRATRNFENWKCDKRGYGMGYGVVFDDGGAAGPEEYRSQIGGATLNGAFTLWVRRPVAWVDGPDADTYLGDGTTLQDYPKNDALVLVAEGVAPYAGSGANTNAFAATNRAVYTIEVVLSRGATTTGEQSGCGQRQGQAGSAASGGNTASCVAITSGTQITEALTGVAGVGTGALK